MLAVLSFAFLMLFRLLSLYIFVHYWCHSFTYSMFFPSDSLVLNNSFHKFVIVCNNLLDSTDILIQIASPYLAQGRSKDSQTSKKCKSKNLTVPSCKIVSEDRRRWFEFLSGFWSDRETLEPWPTDSQVDASWKLGSTCDPVWPGLACTYVDLRTLWLRSNLHASQRTFFPIWPPNPSQRKSRDVH